MRSNETINIIARHANFAAVLLIAAVSLPGDANAQAHHKAKRGRLNITTETHLAGVTLEPGIYEVREKKSADGPIVEFVHMIHNEAASELVQADDEEVVARVRFTGQELTAPAKQTELQLSSNNKRAVALEIRGDSTEYVFDTSQMASQ